MLLIVEILLEQGPESSRLNTGCVHLAGELCQAPQPVLWPLLIHYGPLFSLFRGTALSM